MVKEKLGWDKEFKNVSIYMEVFLFVIIIICLLTRQDLEVIICIGVFCLLELILTLYLNLYSINIYDDKIIIKSLFRSKTYNFDSILIELDVSVRIFNLKYKELLRIGNFIDPNLKIYKAYTRYCKDNKISHINSNNKIKYNYFIKNMSIFGIVFSLIMLSFSGILIYQKIVNIFDDIAAIISFVILGSVFLIPAIFGLLSYINFEIIVFDDSLIVKNFIGIKRKYNIDELKLRCGTYIYKLKLPKNRLIVCPYYLMDNLDILVNVKKY